MNKIKNLEAAADRIKLAVKNNEKIIIYGDSDCDGVCSVVILQEAIKNLGGSVELVMFPNREDDGYGINARAVDFLADKGPALFITLDLGISNGKAIDALNGCHFDVIVVDHHQILDGIPNAKVVVDPAQPGDQSESTHLANVGITFKLAEELLGESMSSQTRKSFLELAALATISDMVPQIKDNAMFIEEGLRSLKHTFRPGLRAFFDVVGEGELISSNFSKIISAINAAESLEFKNDAHALLICSSDAKARDLAKELLDKTAYKQLRIRQIVEEVERRITARKDEPIIFEGDKAWKLLWAGPAASTIYVQHQKPTFIFKMGDEESAGSVRSPKGMDSVQAMKSCKDLLITYGGHPQASGFRLKNENLEKFKEGLIKHFSNLP